VCVCARIVQAIYYFKIAVALAVAAIPEGLPAVVTTCLALGTMKMAKKNAIVRSLPSVETLGCTTVICSDKTGTLTTNMMSVQKILTVDSATKTKVTFRDYLVQGDSWAPIGDIIREGDKKAARVTAVEDGGLGYLGQIAALCNESTLGYHVNKDGVGTYTKTGAPTEAALLVLAEKIGVPDARTNIEIASLAPVERAQAAVNYWKDQFAREHMLEFDRDRKSMSVVVSEVVGKKTKTWLFAKGAAECVIERCSFIRGADGSVVPLTASHVKEIEARLESYAGEGLRCLALAYVEDPSTKFDFKNSAKYADYESNMVFVGLTAMLDPPRAAVNASILKCRSAGIRVIVITGDNKVTAESISRKIGVFGATENLAGKSFTGSEFDQMTPAQKDKAASEASLFARVEPKHKLELVQLLKKQGHVVAMTGDGVNDATALKQADIGIAMGSGTDVAREASKMVLQDDNFATIVMAVEEGRAIYANTKQFIRYLISSNIGEVACIFLTAAIGMPEALIPVQLLWVNLVTDGLPATALGFNPPDKDIMLREPRGRSESIINGWMFFRYLAVGLYVGIGTVGGFIWWYLSATNGPHITWQQLINFHDCQNGTNKELYAGIDCTIFHDARPSTMSLSILVTIEMFNALNALSENQSLLTTPPTSNLYVVLACALSFALHFMIVYVPFFAAIFHVAPLNQEEWLHVLYASLPVFLLDETLKFISRQVAGQQTCTYT
jgi:Ca2+ transporting ATPase